ncbi:MAG: shikimate dehydrogenase family protein [Longimicrobiales bacterium]
MTAAGAPASTTRVYALLGDPVRHSLSPRIQNAAIAAGRIDAVYVALRCAQEDVPGLLRGLARAGGGGNVTVPHKSLAAHVIDAPTEAVRRTGACNTFWLADGAIQGDNTDVAAFTHAAAALIGPLEGRVAVVLGAGGAASAAVCALLDGGASSVEVRNRTHARARALLDRYQDPRLRLGPPNAPLPEPLDLVVNATPLGLQASDPLPAPVAELAGAGVGALLDLVYAPGGTAWVRTAREQGIPAHDGTGMLLAQATLAFERWFGLRPDPRAMRDACAPSPVRLEDE